MQSVVVDSNVFSFIFKKDTRRELCAPDVRGKRVCLCFMSVAELKLWAIVRKWGTRRVESLAEAVRQYVVIPYDAAMSDHWAEITAHREHLGKPIACGDCWIAAAARRHDLPLVTHNPADFADIPGLRIITHAP
ncbi:MAG TPA: type II toxin-antitoxin system VapC family toxin [Pseudonocardiaceae bacterium]